VYTSIKSRKLQEFIKLVWSEPSRSICLLDSWGKKQRVAAFLVL